MKRRLIMLFAAAVAGLGLGGIAQPTQAAVVRTCVGAVETWTFSPPLTTAFASGTADLTYPNNCLKIDSGGGSGLQTYTGHVTLSYTGSCITAALSSGTTTGELVGGTLAVITNTGGGAASVHQLTPILPCSEATAFGVGVGVATF